MSEEREKGFHFAGPERSLCCGDVIPEGRQICPKCEGHGYQYIPPEKRFRDRLREAWRALRGKS